MDYYFEIVIKPDAEMRENVLLNKVYTKFHKALFDLQASDIGVSFPQKKVKLGRVLRVHSSLGRLNELRALKWLGGLSGYCEVSEVLSVPKLVLGYMFVSRVRDNMSVGKLRRLKKRNSLSVDEVKKYKAKMFAKNLDNPYLELESVSSKQRYRLYIAFSELQSTQSLGEFNKFGLSKIATVPVFDNCK